MKTNKFRHKQLKGIKIFVENSLIPKKLVIGKVLSILGSSQIEKIMTVISGCSINSLA